MIALKLNNRKDFMKHLLLSDTFDHFHLIEGEITTFGKFQIDGYLQKEFYNDTDTQKEHLPEFISWEQVRELCFSIIKGKRTPLDFKFVLSLSPDNISRLISRNSLDFRPEDVQGLYLNLRFDGTVLQCITGTSLKTFSLDKSLEQAWDQMVQRFFTQKSIPFEIVS